MMILSTHPNQPYCVNLLAPSDQLCDSEDLRLGVRPAGSANEEKLASTDGYDAKSIMNQNSWANHEHSACTESDQKPDSHRRQM